MKTKKKNREELAKETLELTRAAHHVIKARMMGGMVEVACKPTTMVCHKSGGDTMECNECSFYRRWKKRGFTIPRRGDTPGEMYVATWDESEEESV